MTWGGFSLVIHSDSVWTTTRSLFSFVYNWGRYRPSNIEKDHFGRGGLDRHHKNSSQLEDETLDNGNSTGCPAEDFRFYGCISPEVWNMTKFSGNIGANDIEIPITFENRLLDEPLFVLGVHLDRLEAHING
ncbi:hypothetical protein TNCV_4190712 [Trichonephila clavipes]|nr:hypothetical protein TNCV_4190712 [Trichonephila clavipes]